MLYQRQISLRLDFLCDDAEGLTIFSSIPLLSEFANGGITLQELKIDTTD